MRKTIVIDPVTRIEGHAKITLALDEHGSIADARFHVTQFRGFEKFAEGRPFEEMPSITARICGICPVSHLLTSAKACDELMSVRIPQAAVNLRKVLNLAQIIQSHALNFFYLSSPDFLLDRDTPAAERNVLGLAAVNPELARDGIWLRMFGQKIIEDLAGKRIHPSWVVPGGVNAPLTDETRDRIMGEIPRAIEVVSRTIGLWKETMAKVQEEASIPGDFPTLYMGMVGPDGSLEYYDGTVRMADSRGDVLADGIQPADYANVIAEEVVPWSYLKMTHYKPLGKRDGCYRVGPLARLNVVERCGTALADRELREFRQLGNGGRAVQASFHYHYARLIEALFAIEKIQALLRDPVTSDARVRARASANQNEGIAVTEAPRGTLIHHYRVDDNELITWANLIIATGHNNMAMNRGILQAARAFVKNEGLTEDALNRIETVIRCFDPCLSCSTHALGQMPIHIELVNHDGRILDRKQRP